MIDECRLASVFRLPYFSKKEVKIKMPKRKNTSIKEYALKSGKKRFMFQIYLGYNSNGKPIITRRRGFKSYAEAEAAYNKMALTKPDDFIKQKQIKVHELFDLWFKTYKETVKPQSASRVFVNYKHHINPYFGNNYMDSILVKDLQKWADKLATELVNYRPVISIMRSLYEYGMRLGYISDNSISRIIIPKKTTRKRRNVEDNVYSKEELDTFLDVAKQVNQCVYAYFKLLASTGMRKGEALALTWNDIDLVNNTISVNKTLTSVDHKLILSSPKTKNSRRSIPLSANLKQVLLDYRKSEKIVSVKLFHRLNGNYWSLSQPGDWLRDVYAKDHALNVKYAKEYKLDDSYVRAKDLRHISIHGFRHTFATLLIENTNVKPKTVQMLLGHANIKMTLDIYTHINNKNKEDAINSISQLNI